MLEEIDLVKSVFCLIGTALKVVPQNADEVKQTATLISCQAPFMCSQTKDPWSLIDLSLAKPIQGIS